MLASLNRMFEKRSFDPSQRHENEKQSKPFDEKKEMSVRLRGIIYLTLVYFR